MGRTAGSDRGNICLTCVNYMCEWLTKGGPKYIPVSQCTRYKAKKSTAVEELQAQLPYGD